VDLWARSLARNDCAAEVTFGFFLLQNSNSLFLFFAYFLLELFFLSGGFDLVAPWPQARLAQLKENFD
jgi:hypothetical protein